MKSFDIPAGFRSSFITRIKELRRVTDPRKRDFSPTLLDFGPVQFYIARHFGFCYGVENAIEISYRTVSENPGKRIFLLSQMIHNPNVNGDLESRGIRFLMDTQGKQLIPWDEVNSDDIVIIPAFGTTLKVEKILQEKGIEPHKYDTTCPFVERVWKRAEKLGSDRYSIVIHGKYKHEETRATFSRSELHAPSLIIKDIMEARKLGSFLLGEIPMNEFNTFFKDRYSEGFDPQKDLNRIGVINQTTMLASETQEIADYLKEVMVKKYGPHDLGSHFADTRDTLCYATNENQEATLWLLKQPADLAIVVGGYNSSNTSHLVELCEQILPTYFICGAHEIESEKTIRHYNFHRQQMESTDRFLPQNKPARIILTSGASCPDSVVDTVLDRVLSFYPEKREKREILAELLEED